MTFKKIIKSNNNRQSKSQNDIILIKQILIRFIACVIINEIHYCVITFYGEVAKTNAFPSTMSSRTHNLENRLRLT